MDRNIGVIRRLLTGDMSSEDASSTTMTLAMSLVVGIVLGYAIRSAGIGNSIFPDLSQILEGGGGGRPASGCGCRINYPPPAPRSTCDPSGMLHRIRL